MLGQGRLSERRLRPWWRRPGDSRSVKAWLALVTTLLVGATLMAARLADPTPTTGSAAATAKTTAPLRIYVANSYHAEFSWTREMVGGFTRTLAEGGLVEGRDYVLHQGFMDAFSRPDEPSMRQAARPILREIAALKPGLVFTTDDDALRHVGLRLDDVPVVFAGINGVEKYVGTGRVESLERPGHNLTGVYQTTYYRECISLLQKVVPSIKTFAVVADWTTTSQEQIKELQQILPTLSARLQETHVSDKLEEWQRFVLDLQDRVDAIFLLNANAVHDRSGRKVEPSEVYRWVANHSRLPDTSTWNEPVQSGILLSASDDAANQGHHAATLALRILDGESPGTLAVVTPPNGVPLLNLKRANALRLRLPQEIMNIFVEDGKIFHDF
ncbi:MAG: ABC transporter substrate binding protein [Myxococcota bacterium]